MPSHKIPAGGAKTYCKTIDLNSLCTQNMWQCSFQTLCDVAKERGWDILRKRYWEEQMLSILLGNATSSQQSQDAERALKAIRAKSVTATQRTIDDMKTDARNIRQQDVYMWDVKRMSNGQRQEKPPVRVMSDILAEKEGRCTDKTHASSL